MSVRDLNREQLQQLKIRYLDELLYKEEKRNISYGEMANIDEIVTDEEVYNEYDIYTFVEEDFF